MIYLFLTDSEYVKSKIERFLPNYHQDYRELLKYKYNTDIIYINKFDNYMVQKIFKGIAYLKFKFDKIFLLLGDNISNNFKRYINGLAINLVKSQNDVVVFKLQSIKSYFYYNNFINCVCCNDGKDIYPDSSNAIYVNLGQLSDSDYNPDYFINYLNKNNIMISQKIIRDDIIDDKIPLVTAELISTYELDSPLEIKHDTNNIKPSAPPKNII